jgi:hypothetical protein
MDEVHKPSDCEGLFGLSYLGLNCTAYDLRRDTRKEDLLKNLPDYSKFAMLGDS